MRSSGRHAKIPNAFNCCLTGNGQIQNDLSLQLPQNCIKPISVFVLTDTRDHANKRQHRMDRKW